MYIDNTKKNSSTITRSKILTVRVIKLCNGFPNGRPSWIITDQLIRSASSIGANIVEAQASTSKREFKKFLEIALKSANETMYWLEIGHEVGLINDIASTELLDEVGQLSKILGKSVITLKNVLSKTI